MKWQVARVRLNGTVLKTVNDASTIVHPFKSDTCRHFMFLSASDAVWNRSRLSIGLLQGKCRFDSCRWHQNGLNCHWCDRIISLFIAFPVNAGPVSCGKDGSVRPGCQARITY